jgi:sec-independent protein translocase protein TatB
MIRAYPSTHGRTDSAGIVRSVSFGLTFDKLLIILVIALFLIGPDRLPGYAAQLARLVKTLRGFADGAKERMREEMGPEFDEVDWRKLDPRQYDPRRIIREALVDEVIPPAKPVSANGPAPASRYRESAYEQRQRKLGKSRPAPFDPEAT